MKPSVPYRDRQRVRERESQRERERERERPFCGGCSSLLINAESTWTGRNNLS